MSAGRILIVDDERSIRELLEIFLKKEGFTVSSVSSADIVSRRK